MKKTYTLFLSLFTVAVALAQNPIPNANFSTYWTSSPGQPNGWTDSRDISQISPGNPITGWAAQGYKTASTYPAFITSSGSGTTGIAVTQSYTHFNLYYKFASVSSDIMTITVRVRNAAHTQIGSGFSQITGSVGSFTALSIPINYTGTNPADVIISVLMNASDGISNPHATSNFIIDDLELTGTATAINEAEKENHSLHIFPNPASQYLQIQATLVNSKISDVHITDMTGRIVKQINQIDFSQGSFSLNISDLPSGNYQLAVKSDEVIETKNIVVK